MSLPEYPRREARFQVQIPRLPQLYVPVYQHLEMLKVIREIASHTFFFRIPSSQNRTALNNKARDDSPLKAKLVVLHAGHNYTIQQAVSLPRTNFSVVDSISIQEEVVYSYDIDLITWLWGSIDATYPMEGNLHGGSGDVPSAAHFAMRLPFHIYSETSVLDQKQMQMLAEQDRIAKV